MGNRYKIQLGEPVRVFCAPINECTSRWGVYCIPRLWRRQDGSLVIRENGAEDNGYLNQVVPNLYFQSFDEGKTWKPVADGEKRFSDDRRFLNGINPLFYKRKNGDIIGIRRKDLPPITGLDHIKEFPNCCLSNYLYVYRYSDLEDKFAGMEFVCYRNGKVEISPIKINFPDWELAVCAKGSADPDGESIPQMAEGNEFVSMYLTSLCEMQDGKLCGLLHGQAPDVSDRACENVYFAVSDDGRNWDIRALAVNGEEMTQTKSGALGDGAEMSLAVLSNGTLLIAMRNDCSYPYPHFCDTTIAASHDNGFTWSKPEAVYPSSVTPHIIAFPDECALLIAGRPGVHCLLSEDGGKTFGEPVSIIGKTLKEELAAGKEYGEAKYSDTSSYSNTFVERLNSNTVLVIYTDLNADDGDGQKHKATYVRTVRIIDKNA